VKCRENRNSLDRKDNSEEEEECITNLEFDTIVRSETHMKAFDRLENEEC
jgi:hypothetical protein